MKTKKRGSGLFAVLIISTALGVGIYSVMNLVLGELRRNKKAAVYNEAKQAAESILQSSLSDLETRFNQRTAFPTNALSPSIDPLFLSTEFINRYTASGSGSHLLIPTTTKYTSTSQFNTQNTEVIGGQIPPGQWRYIDPRESGNESDRLAGTRVFERSVELLSKATVSRPNIGSSTVYARQFLQVRDSPLFAYAIFYNLPMEIAPGPKMEVHGNIHVNDNAWFQASNGLDIYSRITLSGKILHGRNPDTNAKVKYGAVRITNSAGTLISMQEDSSWPANSAADFGGGWLESTSTNFLNGSNFNEISTQIWDYNVQTVEHGVLPQNPVGVTEYIEDTDSSTAAKESFNSAYQIIQPTLSEAELNIPDQSTDPNGYKAGVALNEIEEQKYAYKAGLVIKVGTTGTLSYITYERDANGDIVYESGQPKARTLSPSTAIAEYKAFQDDSNGVITQGLHDKRQAQDVNLVELDVGKLKDLVHANQGSDWGGGASDAPSSWWNGVVYVEYPQKSASSSRPDNVNPAVSGEGVKLKNGSVIPNPSFGHAKGIYGSSFATNQMLYVEGHFNADGDRNTGSPTAPDDPSNFAKEGHEAPAAIIADSITFLSEVWDDANSAKSRDQRIAKDTEVSAAVLTGLVPSGEDGGNGYSGGVENFPRFQEDWSGGKSLRLRGSLVALFESEVATRRWGSGDVYKPPNRDWGFHEKFAEGYLPPGTPNTRRFRATDFQLINASDYAAHVARIKTYF